MPSPRVVLVGPPGAGKTTVGGLLADELGATFLDTDAAIEQTEGRTISDIFVEDGESHFRALEQEQVVRSLAEQDGVLALGGGAVMSQRVQQALAGHRVVFLDVAIADAASRVGFDGSRPLLAVNPRATWTRMMNSRRATYQAVATHRVDTAGRTPQQVVEEIRTLTEDT